MRKTKSDKRKKNERRNATLPHIEGMKWTLWCREQQRKDQDIITCLTAYAAILCVCACGL